MYGRVVFTCREVYQEYCDVMTRLALDVTEVLAVALGLGRGELRGFFADGDPVMRLNHYRRAGSRT